MAVVRQDRCASVMITNAHGCGSVSNTILLSFILVVGQPNGMTVPEARKAMEVAVDKLNTLKPYTFKALSLIRMRDPFMDKDEGAERLVAWNNYFTRRHNAATYIHVFDVNRDTRIAGVAFHCQSLKRRKQVSVSLNKESSLTFKGIVAAHEIGHQLGFEHAGVYDKPWSIMDEFIYMFKNIRHTRWFAFVDRISDLKYMGCKENGR